METMVVLCHFTPKKWLEDMIGVPGVFLFDLLGKILKNTEFYGKSYISKVFL